MTTVSSVSNGAVAQQSVTDQQKASLDYDSFLKLLLQQLKSQDPTDPVDQKETLAQLASFSNVEQSIKLNQKLELLLARQGVGETAGLIGRRVESLTGEGAGTVQAVEVVQGEMFVVLDTGSRINVTSGVRVTA